MRLFDMRSISRLTFLGSLSLSLSLVWGQSTGGPTTGTGTTGTGTTGTGTTGTPGGTTGTTPGRPGVPGMPGQQQQQREDPFRDMQRPIFLAGKVLLSDGTVPNEPVTIERVCNGIPRPEGYTDSKGRFSFQLGQNMGMLADASVSSVDGRLEPGGGGPSPFGGMPGTRGFTERDLFGCELRASLPGFRSDVIPLSNRRFLDNPDVGTIVLHRLGNVEGLTISATTAAAPKDARKAHDKGMELARKGKMDEAFKEFEKAVTLYPQYAVAWHRLGMVQEAKGDREGARKSFAEALKCDSKYISPLERLYLMAAQENKWEDTLALTEKVLRMNPYDFPTAYYFNAVANLQLHKLDAAEKSAREAVKIDKLHRMPKAEYVLGIVLAQKEDFNEAAEHLRSYLKMVPEGKESILVKQQLAEVEKFAQKR